MVSHEEIIHVISLTCHIVFEWKVSKGNVGYPWESTRDIHQHIPPIYGLYNGCIGQYGVILVEQLLGYTPKGTQLFPLKVLLFTVQILFSGRNYSGIQAPCENGQNNRQIPHSKIWLDTQTSEDEISRQPYVGTGFQPSTLHNWDAWRVARQQFHIIWYMRIRHWFDNTFSPMIRHEP